jgi:hypothetical protein
MWRIDVVWNIRSTELQTLKLREFPLAQADVTSLLQAAPSLEHLLLPKCRALTTPMCLSWARDIPRLRVVGTPSCT